MSTASLATPTLITAEQFDARPDPGCPDDLVRGTIVPTPMPRPRHSQICGRAYYLFYAHIDAQDLGHLLCNDTGVITECGPDTVRGADISFYNYARVSKGALPISGNPARLGRRGSFTQRPLAQSPREDRRIPRLRYHRRPRTRR